MTWTSAGVLNPNNNAGPSSFSLTPSAAGNMLLLAPVQYANGTVYATALSSSNITWAAVGHCLGTSLAFTAALFIGTVTAASAATVTVTWSGTVPTGQIIISGQEFHSTAGTWAVDTSATLNSAGTATWPTLTPSGTGELYFGYAVNNGTAVAGTTPGFTYDPDTSANGIAWDLNVSAAAAPVWGDTGHAVGVMALIKESGAIVAKPGIFPGRQQALVTAATR